MLADEVAELTLLLAREGRTYQHGELVKKHPAAGMRDQAMRSLRLFADSFGLTPQARQRLDAPEEPAGEDPFDQFLKGANPN